MNDNTIAAILTAAGAIVVAFFTFRGAAKTSGPSAQEALNAGFTALTERQLNELLQLRSDVMQLSGKVSACERRISETERQLSMSQRVIAAAVWFIDRLVEWGQAGGSGEIPVPPSELHEHLSQSRWRNGT